MLSFEDAALPAGLSWLAAADVQDHLLMVSSDLDRLQTLLSHACDELMQSFHAASARLRALDDESVPAAPQALAAASELGQAVVALQFEDMASQLIAHSHRRLRSCIDQLAQQTFADDDGPAALEAAPLHPNPVTQDEMDAGSVELF